MSYEIIGAIVKEQDVTFAIVEVKRHVIQSSIEAKEAQNAYSYVFPGMPIILEAQGSGKKPSYYGRNDIVNFLAKIDPRRIPWRRYIIT